MGGGLVTHPGLARTALRWLNEGTVSLHFSSLGMQLARAGAPCPSRLSLRKRFVRRPPSLCAP